MKKMKKLGLGAGVISAITCLVIVGLLVNMNISDTVVNPIVEEERIRHWQYLRPLGDADPGAGESGILIAGIADNDATWTSNLTYGTDTYHITETNDTHAGDNVPYDTEVYLFVKCRFNRDDLVDTDGADEYTLNWCSAWLNSTILGASSVEMTEANVSGCNAGEFIWVHFYAGPYTWNRGQNVTDIQMKVKVYK